MDISGVDVDCLSDEEILELCGDIVDCGNDEIFILDKTNVNELTDSKTEELYDEVLYSKNNNLTANNIKLTDEQVMDLNFKTIDMEKEEICLLKGGMDINFENLSDEEIYVLYDDMVSSENEQILIATYYMISAGYVAELCSTTDSGIYCYNPNTNSTVKILYLGYISDYSFYAYGAKINFYYYSMANPPCIVVVGDKNRVIKGYGTCK